MGAKNPFYGKSHTEGFKEKLSNDRKGTWCVGEDNAMHGVNIWDTYSKKEKEEKRKKISDGQTGSKNHFYGKHHSEEMKRRMSEFWKQKFIEDPSHMRRIQKMALEKQKKGFKSSIERKTQVELERRGFTFRYSKVLHRKYQFDFIICDEILLEVHGDYWHANPKYYGDGKKEINATQKKKIELDERKKVYANSYGYEIFYIWENEVNDGNFSVLDRIEKEIKRRSKWKNTN